jgi:multicomponent K+:H+ antiporter subunit D
MTALVAWCMPHLVVAPILLPMATAAVMLLLGEGRRSAKVALGVTCSAAGLAASAALLWWASTRGTVSYVPGGWPATAGIAIVADRLAALMLVLAWTLGGCAVVFGAARWQRAGVHFNPLVQLELMGLSGAFLAGDLFNLFVFFEILLAASYGLLLHGSGRSRIVSGLHYVAVNLAASSLFLIGATLLYGVTGTLNLAALAEHWARVAAEDRGLLHAAAAVLAVAFLAKAAAWPLNFWLVPAYSAATAPAAALFAILTKVGVYALLRTSALLSPGGEAAPLGGDALLLLGSLTAVLAALAMLGTHRLVRQAALSVVVSAGTLLAAVGLGRATVTAGALFYLVSSALTASALFLVVDLVERWQNAGATIVEPAPYLTAALEQRDVNLDDEEEPLVGVPFPASTAFLGVVFLACTVLVAGLPPLSSFVGKVAMISGALGGLDGGAVPSRAWLFLAVLLGTGLSALVAMLRSGIRTFWSATATRRERPRIRLAEGGPIVVLLAACVGLTLGAGPAMRYALDAARTLHGPRPQVGAVLGDHDATSLPEGITP